MYTISRRLSHFEKSTIMAGILDFHDIHMYLHIKFREDSTIFDRVRILAETHFRYDVIVAILKIDGENPMPLPF